MPTPLKKRKVVLTFGCPVCGRKFSVSVKDPEKAKNAMKMGVPCPFCAMEGRMSTAKLIKTDYIDDVEKLRKVNQERTMAALRQAAIFQAANPQPEMVTLTPSHIQSPFGSTPLRVPKPTLEKLKKKSKEYLEINHIT